VRNKISRTNQRIIVVLAAVGMAFVAQAQTYTYSTLYSFKNNGKDPSNPLGGALIIDAAGNLYGAGVSGGTYGKGAVFQISKTGTETVLYSFKGSPDGESPNSKLVRDSKGNLYGTTFSGGIITDTYGDCSDYAGCGTVFKLSSSGVETVLYGFTGGKDGAIPQSSVVLDSAENVYGTVNQDLVVSGDSGNGLAFEITTNKTFSILYEFCSLNNCLDGQNPLFGPIRDSEGNLYGVVLGGGSDGYGGVYQLTPSGVETLLHSFTFGNDGAEPWSTLKRDSAGNLYGGANWGGSGTYGTGFNGGTLFKITRSGAFSVLYSFCSLPNCADGDGPRGPIQIDRSGNLYSTTVAGGANGSGTVFEVSSTGKETVLYNFASQVTTFNAGLVIDSSGNLYGTTYNGGPAHLGSVYKLTLKK